MSDRVRGVLLAKLDLGEDLAACLRSGKTDFDPEYTKARLQQDLAVFWGRDHSAWVVGTEGVGWKVTPTKPLVVDVFLSKEGSFDILPRYNLKLTYEDLAPRETDELVDLADWVRVFGSRLEENFWLWHHTIAQGANA